MKSIGDLLAKLPPGVPRWLVFLGAAIYKYRLEAERRRFLSVLKAPHS